MPEVVKITLCIAPAAIVGFWVASIFILVTAPAVSAWYALATFETGICLGLISAVLVAWQISRRLFTAKK